MPQQSLSHPVALYDVVLLLGEINYFIYLWVVVNIYLLINLDTTTRIIMINKIPDSTNMII